MYTDLFTSKLSACRYFTRQRRFRFPLGQFGGFPDGEYGVEPQDLEIREAGKKGQGTFAVNLIRSGSWICEYPGKFSQRPGKKQQPPENWTVAGNYSMYFEMKDKQDRTVWFCRDANDSSFQGHFGSKINHPSRSDGEKPNVKPIPVTSYSPPRVFFKALRDILPGEELLYNYGETDKKAIEQNPFLA